ncbi:MAG: hypothetical protein ACK5V0_01680 [Alphaproteobacteria bacterium]
MNRATGQGLRFRHNVWPIRAMIVAGSIAAFFDAAGPEGDGL